MSNLKPCPFCGGDAKVRKSHENFLVHPADCWMVQCADNDCGCGTSFESSEYKAVAAWNRRAGIRRDANA